MKPSEVLRRAKELWMAPGHISPFEAIRYSSRRTNNSTAGARAIELLESSQLHDQSIEELFDRAIALADEAEK